MGRERRAPCRGIDQREGSGRNHQFIYGTCEAWRFPYGRTDEKGRRNGIYVSSDCTTVFKTGNWELLTVRSGLRRKSVTSERLADFVDVATGRHTLRLRAYVAPIDPLNPARSQAQDPDYTVSRANLPSAAQLAQIIAGIEVDRGPMSIQRLSQSSGTRRTMQFHDDPLLFQAFLRPVPA